MSVCLPSGIECLSPSRIRTKNPTPKIKEITYLCVSGLAEFWVGAEATAVRRREGAVGFGWGLVRW